MVPHLFHFSVGCVACGCEPAGSDPLVCNKTTGQCPCKAQAIQRQCNVCPSGHYGLNTNNPAGCLKCQCSGKSSDCTADSGWFNTQVKTELPAIVNNVDPDGWTAVDGNGEDAGALWDFIVLK